MSGLRLNAAHLAEAVPQMKAGDRVLLSGMIYTARDAAHKRLFELLDAGNPLPFELKGAVIYYAGPTPGQQGMAVGACGPHHGGADGRLCAPFAGSGADRHDRQGGAQSGGGGQPSCATGPATLLPWAARERLSPGAFRRRRSSPLTIWAVSP